jgi:ELWxxDGT repeat protein
VTQERAPGAQLRALNGRLFFVAGTPETGFELWRSDGTPSGTVPLPEVAAGPEDGGIEALVATGQRLFFSASDPLHGRELWTVLNNWVFKDGFESTNTSAWSMTVP